MEYTSNYHLSKPEGDDIINPTSRTGYNGNFDTLDTTLELVSNKANTNESNITTLQGDVTTLQGDVADLEAKTGEDIPFESGSVDSISDKITILYNLVVPVGSVLCFTNDTNPNNIYQGTTWQKIEGRFLLGSSSSYALGSTGGSADAVVVQHKHFVVGGNAGQGAIEISSGTSFAVNNFFNSTSAPGVGYLLRYTPNGPTYADRGNSSLEGVDGTGKNMPPYEVVNYWKRTA